MGFSWDMIGINEDSMGIAWEPLGFHQDFMVIQPGIHWEFNGVST